jgi:hypothetical protein
MTFLVFQHGEHSGTTLADRHGVAEETQQIADTDLEISHSLRAAATATLRQLYIVTDLMSADAMT